MVVSRLECHLQPNSLLGDLQSAYRTGHSTETALLRVHHDITSALDNNSCTVLVMLDLSAAFDVIDHKIIFQRLEYSYGISGPALAWIRSYLTIELGVLRLDLFFPNGMHLKYGVPQGSVSGPILYCLFSKPIGEICRQHDMDYHCYADDTQVYLVIEPLDKWTDISSRIEVCLADISDWMRSNLLKLNQDKTELIVFAPKHWIKDFSDCRLSFDGAVVINVSCVRNLGILFDKTLSIEKQVSATSKSCFYQIRNIGRIRTYITDDACKTLVNSLVTSRLDYGNVMLYGLPANITNKLQRVQNTAVRLISRTEKHQHITPILVSLHWLPGTIAVNINF